MCVVTVDRALATWVEGSMVTQITTFGTVTNGPTRPTPDGRFQSLVTVVVTELLNGQPGPNRSSGGTTAVYFEAADAGDLHHWDSATKWPFTVPCGSVVQVRAYCADNPDCFDVQTFTIDCDCPRAVLTSSVTPGCNEDGRVGRDGTRTATFSVRLSNLRTDGPVVGAIHLGSGVAGSAMLPVLLDPTDPGPEWSAEGDGFVGTFPFNYLPGTYEDVFFELTFPGACKVSVPLSDGPLEIGDCVTTNCPDDIAVAMEVTAADGPPSPVPVGPGDPCLPAGDYVVTVAQPVPVAGRDYTWFVDGRRASGPNDNGFNRSRFPLSIAAGSSSSVSVQIRTPNCEPPARSEPIILRACGATPQDPPALPAPQDPPVTQDPPAPPAIDWCLVWFWINIPLMIITGIVVLVAFCLVEASVWTAIAALLTGGLLAEVWAALTAVNIAMLVLSAILMVATLASFIAWLAFCAPGRTDACSLLAALMTILSGLVALSFIVGIVFFLMLRIGCSVGGFVDVAWFGILLSLAWWVSQIMGCRLQQAN